MPSKPKTVWIRTGEWDLLPLAHRDAPRIPASAPQLVHESQRSGLSTAHTCTVIGSDQQSDPKDGWLGIYDAYLLLQQTLSGWNAQLWYLTCCCTSSWECKHAPNSMSKVPQRDAFYVIVMIIICITCLTPDLSCSAISDLWYGNLKWDVINWTLKNFICNPEIL